MSRFFPPPPPPGNAMALAQQQQGIAKEERVLEEPPVPPDLIGMLGRWRKGKKKWVNGKSIELAASAIEVFDADKGALIHPIDSLEGYSSNEELAIEIWTKCKDRARIDDDGLNHYFLVRCHFADLSGNRSFEDHAFPVMLPREYAQWGAQDAYAHHKYGAVLARHPMAHHAYQEIEAMGLAHNLIRFAVNKLAATVESQERTIQRLTEREMAVHEMQLKAQEDLAKRKYEEMKMDAMVATLKAVGGRLAAILPMFGMKLMDAAASKLNGKEPVTVRTIRDEYAFKAICMFAEKLKALGAKTPEELKQALSMPPLSIDPDDPIYDVLFPVLMEREVEKARIKAEQDAKTVVPIDVILKKANEAGEGKIELLPTGTG